MKFKIISIISSLLLFLNIITPLSFANDNSLDNIEEVAIKEVVENPVLNDLIRQAGDDYRDDDSLSIIVEINDLTMKSKYSLTVPDIADVTTDEGLKKQIAYARKSQEILLDKFDELEFSYLVEERYDTVLNGFSIKTDFKTAKQMAVLEEIIAVEISRVIPAPELNIQKLYKTKDATSNEMVKVEDAWRKNFTGKGQLIAVIDSGIDPDHEAVRNIDENGIKISSQADLTALLASKEITNGKFFSKKIPFGFNYADRNNTLKGKSAHGMHVAGIVAGNSNEIRGIVPDAQLVVMRVFSDGGLFGGGTTPTIYNKAIDDAVKLGVDSINMSLGSTGNSENRIEQATYNVLKDAQRAGIAVAIAAGNDGFMGLGAIEKPGAHNPDFGLINSPSTVDVSISVASVDNTKVKQQTFVVEASADRKIVYKAGSGVPKFEANKSYQFANGEYGYETNLQNVSGKVAIIKRGDEPSKQNLESTFATKAKNAQNAGAVGVVIYNNVGGNELVSMSGLENITIPVVFVKRADGEFILQNLNSTLKFAERESILDDPNGYNMSIFSSWGMTPEGNFKPDISAPGGNIYSSVHDGEYKVDSGTSMATPHVAGGIAIVKEYVERQFPNVRGVEKHLLIKNILMSTATPRFNAENNAYISPRGQGAGLMDLKRATNTSVVVQGTNNISSINLKSITGNVVNISGKLKNYSSEERVFDYYVVMATDKVENGKITLLPKLVKNTENNKKEIRVAGNSEQEFNISIELTEQELAPLKEQMTNGFFLDGYVFFKSKDNNEDVNIPFVGLKGDWNKLLVIEESIYDMVQKNQRPYYYEKINDIFKYPFTHLSSKVAGKEIALGELEGNTKDDPKFDKNKIAFSPNSDGNADEVKFVGTFLRNYKDVEIEIFKENDTVNPIYSMKDTKNGLKNFNVANPLGPRYTTTSSKWVWDGKNQIGDLQADGKYKMVVKAKLDGSDDAQTKLEFPVVIDTIFPRIVKSSYDRSTGVYKLEQLVEEGSGIREKKIIIGDTVYTPDNTGKFTLPAGTDPEQAKIRIIDNAFNKIELTLKDSIRSGNEKVVLVIPEISAGSVPQDKYKWKVVDAQNNEVNPYNIAVGSYTLVVYNVDDNYEVANDKIPFTIGENDTTKEIKIKFIYKNKQEVFVRVDNNRNASVKIVLVDKKSGQEYIMIKANEQGGTSARGSFVAFVPPGDYKLTVKDLQDGYYAKIIQENITVNNFGAEFGSSVTISALVLRDVTVNVQRNGYNGKFVAIFKMTDHLNTTYQVEFEEGENSKTVKLPNLLDMDVFTRILDSSDYGSETMTYKVEGINPQPVNIVLKQGTQSQIIPLNKEVLKLKINTASSLKEKDYAEGWEQFEIALEKAEEIFKKENTTQTEIDKAAEELQSAMDNLVRKTDMGDKNLLLAKIREGEDIYSKINADEYVPSTIENLRIVLEAARYAYSSDDPSLNTETQIEQLISNIDLAIQNLQKIAQGVDKNLLKIAIDRATEILNNSNEYKLEGIDSLRQAVELARETFAEENATQDEVNSALRTLNDFLYKIERNTNKTNLDNEIAQSEAIDLMLYKVEGKSEFRLALKKAKEIKANAMATQQEIDDVTNMLREARGKLVPKDNVPSVDKTALIQKLAEAETKNQNSYTAESYNNLKTAIENAKAVRDNQNATQIEVTNAINNLQTAITNLVQKPQTPSNPGGSGGNGGSGGSSGGSTGGGSSSGGSSGGGGGAPTPKVEEKKEVKVDASKETYIKGYEDNTFRPQNNITRAEIVMLLSRFIKDDKKTESKFADVKTDVWYKEALDKLNANNVLVFTGNSFNPQTKLTRAELVAMIVKMKNIVPQGDITFKDKADSDWANGYIAIAVKEGWVNGYEDNTFRPNAPVTRAEIAKIIVKAFNVTSTKTELKFTDLAKTHWAYEYILKLV